MLRRMLWEEMVRIIRRLWPLLLVTFMIMPVTGTFGTAGSFAASVTAAIRVSGDSPFAACTGGSSAGPGASTLYVNTEVEPYIAVNPRSVGSGHVNLIGVWQQDRWSSGAARGLIAAHSSDGGKSWEESPLPFGLCAPGGSDLTRVSDPWISIGPDGTAYAVAIGFNARTSVVVASVSHDGGATWSDTTDVIADAQDQFFNDKESVTADPVKPGVAYVTWSRIRQPADKNPNALWFARTVDGGKTWSKPQEILPAGPEISVEGDVIVVDPRSGALYDFFGNQALHRIRRVCTRDRGRKICKRVRDTGEFFSISFVKSMDGGLSWSKMQTVSPIVRARFPEDNVGRLRAGTWLPSAAIDSKSGKLYVAWSDGRFNGTRMSGTALSSSVDGGKHWSAPLRANAPARGASVTPSIAVNSVGGVGLTYYAVPTAPANASTLPASYWFSSSIDGGAHFRAPVRVAGPFELKTAPLSGGYFLGDYQGLVAVGRSFQLFFATTNTGNLDNRTDIFTMRVVP